MKDQKFYYKILFRLCREVKEKTDLAIVQKKTAEEFATKAAVFRLKAENNEKVG